MFPSSVDKLVIVFSINTQVSSSKAMLSSYTGLPYAFFKMTCTDRNIVASTFFFLHNCIINNNLQYLDLIRCFNSIMGEILESEQWI